MNLGLVTSYIIGGIILLSILMMNMSLSSSSTEITMTQVMREKAATVSEMIAHDIQKMGYNRESKTDPIIEKAQKDRIVFFSNIDDSEDDGEHSVEKITWEFIPDPALTAPENPDTFCNETPKECVLMRSVEYESGELDKTPIRAGVTEFNIKYYEDYGESLDENMDYANGIKEDIRQLYIKLALESSEKIYKNAGGEGRYVKSVWEKRFSPPNLEDTES